MKKVLLAIAMVMLVGSVNAFAFSLIDPLTGSAYFGGVEIKFDNWDFGTVYGQNGNVFSPLNNPGGQNLVGGAAAVAPDTVIDSFGIATVTSILRDPAVDGGAINNTLWSALNPQGEGLEIVFWGLDDVAISSDGLHLFSAAGSGSYLRVYLDTTPDISPSTGVAGFPNNVGNAGDILLLDTVWVPGVNALYPTAAYEQALSNPGANPPLGTGEGYLAVVGGTLKDMFDSNGFLGGAADLHLKSSFNPDPSGNWTVLSHDPVKGTVIPEPTSMVLLGIGLAGLARLRKRS